MSRSRWQIGERSDHAAAGALATPRPYRTEEVVGAWGRDPRVAAVAGVLTGTGLHVDLGLVAEGLLSGQALPDNPYRTYTAEGLRKLRDWKRVWALQDQEDRGEPLHDLETAEPLEAIPVPPKWVRGYFQHADFFKLRGKLNVPRERFVHFSDLSPPAWGWNGWRGRERALAQVEAFSSAETDPLAPLPLPTAADPRRCGVTLGLWEALPDVLRWGDAAEHAELKALAGEVCGDRKGCPCPVLPQWQAFARGEWSPEIAEEAAASEVSLEERARLMDALVLFGTAGATAAELGQRWPGEPTRLSEVLDDLVASGDVQIVGTGRGRRYRGRA